MDFTKLDMATLKRYKRHYRLKTRQNVTKTELALAVAKHFASQHVDEVRPPTPHRNHNHLRATERPTQSAGLAGGDHPAFRVFCEVEHAAIRFALRAYKSSQPRSPTPTPTRLLYRS